MSDSLQTAIRVGDDITHSDALFGGVTGMILGGLAGLVIGAAIVAATVLTGGLALAVFIGWGLLGVAAGGTLGKILGQHSPTPHPKGKVLTGSPNVFVGGKPAARADADVAHCEEHSDSDNARDQPSVRGKKIMQGSGTVFINAFYASRKGDKGHCDFRLGEGFPTVFIGGPTQTIKVKDPKTGKDMEIESETSSIDGLIWGAGIVGGVLVMLPAGAAIVAEGTLAKLGMGAIAKQLAVRLGGQVLLGLGLSTGGGAGLKYVGGKVGGEGSLTQDLFEFGGQTLTPFVGAIKLPGVGKSAYGLIDGIPARFPDWFGSGGKTPPAVPPERTGTGETPGDGDTAGTGDKAAADAAPVSEPEPAQALPANTPHLPELVPAPEATPEVAAPKTGEPVTEIEPLPKLEPELPEPKPAPETEDPEVARVMQVYDALGDRPPKVDMSKNDAAYTDAHTLERHGPDIPLERNSAPVGDRTIEGRIYGDAPWRTPGSTPPARPDNYSYKWKDASTMNRTVNDYLQDNWEQVRSDLALEGRHEATFNTGNAVGEGYYNSGQYGVGPRQAVYGQTSMATITINTVPGNPSAINIVRAYPNGSGSQ